MRDSFLKFVDKGRGYAGDLLLGGWYGIAGAGLGAAAGMFMTGAVMGVGLVVVPVVGAFAGANLASGLALVGLALGTGGAVGAAGGVLLSSSLMPTQARGPVLASVMAGAASIYGAAAPALPYLFNKITAPKPAPQLAVEPAPKPMAPAVSARPPAPKPVAFD